MTKKELIQQVSAATGTPNHAVEKIIDATIANIKNNVIKGETIFIRGFATIGRKHQAPKVGRNLSTGQKVEVPARDVPYLKPAAEFKEQVIKSSIL